MPPFIVCKKTSVNGNTKEDRKKRLKRVKKGVKVLPKLVDSFW